MFRSRSTIRLTGLATILIAGLCLVYLVFFDSFAGPDFALTDFFHRQAIDDDRGPGKSERVAYLTLTDDTYRSFDQNVLDRGWLARVNRALDSSEASAIAYDLIFTRPARSPEEDAAFRAALKASGRVFLPMGFALCDEPCFLRAPDARRFRSNLTSNTITPAPPRMIGNGAVLTARRGVFQQDVFARAAAGQGHVSAPADPDRVQRHFVMLVRANDTYVPALALALYLDELGLELSDLVIEWGEHIRIPARPERGLEQDRLIPIDRHGRAYVPFAGRWNADFPQMHAEELLRHAADPGLSGNLADFFGDRAVLIGDVSSGAADAASTPLESRVPLVALHAHLLNALYTGDFYRRAPTSLLIFLLILGASALGFTALLRRAFVFYLTMALLSGALFVGGWIAFYSFILLPTVSLFGGLALLFSGTLVALRISLSRERTSGLLRLNRELVALKNHLEDLVTERTRDLKTSLGQIEADLETARHVQQKILPGLDLNLGPAIEYFYEYQPLDRVGGDLIDITEIKPGVIRIFLADAVGHGVQASLLTMAVYSEYQELKTDFAEPHELLVEYNRRLIAKYNMRLFTYIPCFLADLHLVAGRLLHASSGLPDQYCMLPDQPPAVLSHTGPAIGFLPDPKITTITTPFPPGAQLVLYSDGLPETHGDSGEMFGEEGVEATLQQSPHLGPTEIVAELLRRAQTFRGSQPVLDDLTLLALRRKIGDG